MAVSLCKIRYVLEFIRRQGPLPRDEHGQVLSPYDMLAWFGLRDCLSLEELSYMERELAAMIEAELTVERLKQAEQARPGT